VPPCHRLDVSAAGKGYYYGVVPSTPMLMPPRIDAEQVERTRDANAEAADDAASEGNQKSDYYYAHRRKIDFHVPTPMPQRIN
jgi:hypothetical protein